MAFENSNMWREGYKLTRENGDVITLTPAELHKIRNTMDAVNGLDSIEYYWEDFDERWEDAPEERQNQLKEAFNAIINDEQACFNLWDGYLTSIMEDTYDYETDSIEYELDDWINTHLLEK